MTDHAQIVRDVLSGRLGTHEAVVGAMDALDALVAERDEARRRQAELEGAIHALVNAAERLSRPGSQGEEMVNAAAMTNALMDAAKLVGNVGVFPEMGGS